MTTIDKKNFQKKILSTVGITFAVLAVFSIVIFFLIEYLDKSIVEIGKKHGIDTPLNSMLTVLVKVLEKRNM